jgi:hypothetical protein
MCRPKISSPCGKPFRNTACISIKMKMPESASTINEIGFKKHLDRLSRTN